MSQIYDIYNSLMWHNMSQKWLFTRSNGACNWLYHLRTLSEETLTNGMQSPLFRNFEGSNILSTNFFDFGFTSSRILLFFVFIFIGSKKPCNLLKTLSRNKLQRLLNFLQNVFNSCFNFCLNYRTYPLK